MSFARAVAKHPDRGDADVEDAAFAADLLADAIHLRTRLPGGLEISDTLCSPISGPLEFGHRFRRDVWIGHHGFIFRDVRILSSDDHARTASDRAGKPKRYLVPYFIACHPGSDLNAMIDPDGPDRRRVRLPDPGEAAEGGHRSTEEASK